MKVEDVRNGQILSSIPVQFLARVKTTAHQCDTEETDRPRFVDPTPKQGVVVDVPSEGIQFTIAITMSSTVSK